MRWAKPRTAVSGLRISWATVAAISDLHHVDVAPDFFLLIRRDRAVHDAADALGEAAHRRQWIANFVGDGRRHFRSAPRRCSAGLFLAYPPGPSRPRRG